MSSNTLSQIPIYNPNTNSGCVLWLDATDPNGNGIAVANGSTISTWVDKSGAGNNASGGVSPSYNSTGINNLGAVSFNGSTTYLNSQDLYSNRSFSVFSIVRRQASISSQVAFISGTTDAVNQNFHLCWRTNTTLGLGFYGNDIDYTSFPTYTGSTSSEPAYLIEATYTPGSRNLLVNGSIVASDANSTNLTADVGSRIGGGGSFAGVFFTGFIGEIIVYNGIPNTVIRQQAEGYLAWKWGLQSNLPSNHPYKNAAPNFITALPRQFRNLGTIPMAPSSSAFSFFNPVSVGGCQLWLDAADPSAFVLSGTNVTQWNDKSGNGYNATTATSPTYSFGSVNFDGTGQYLSTNYPATNATETMFIIYTYVSGGFIIACSTNGGRVIQNAGSEVWISINNVGLWSTGFALPTNTRLLQSIARGSSSGLNYYNNGTSVYSSATSYVPSASNTTLIGKAGFQVGFYLNGSINEIIAYNVLLSTTQRQQVEGYLAWKWGLPSQLPSNHPYKNAPPGLSIPVVPQNRQLANRVFNPLSFSGCDIWMDASDPNGTGIAPASGATISTWVDKSGNGRNFSANGTATASSFTINGLRTMDLTSGAYFSNSYALPASYSVFVVGYSTSGGTNAILSCSPDAVFMMRAVGGALVAFAGNGTSWNVSIGGVTITSNSIISFTQNNSGGGTSALYSNSSLASSGTGNTTTGTGFYIGYRYISGNNWYGYVCELLIYNTPLSANQRQSVEAYLAYKWGLVGSLPSTQPYKRWPPPP